MRLSDLGPKQTHLTHPLLPVVGTPVREKWSTMGDQDVGHKSAISPTPRVGGNKS